MQLSSTRINCFGTMIPICLLMFICLLLWGCDAYSKQRRMNYAALKMYSDHHLVRILKKS